MQHICSGNFTINNYLILTGVAGGFGKLGMPLKKSRLSS